MEKKKYTVSDRLKELLVYRGLQQQDLAKRTGLDISTISLYVSGKRTPKADKVALIAESCNVSPTWLLGYDVNPTSGIIKPVDVNTDVVAMVATDARYHEIMVKIAKLPDDQLELAYNIISAMLQTIENEKKGN